MQLFAIWNLRFYNSNIRIEWAFVCLQWGGVKPSDIFRQAAGMAEKGKENKRKASATGETNPARISAEEKGELTPRDQVFRDEYLVDLNPYRAAKAAGYAETVARTKAFQWVKNPELKPLLYKSIQEAMKDRSARTGITQDKVLERYWHIATADPNELTQIRRNNCRHCHGINHEFQWKDEQEYESHLRAAIAEEKAIQADDPNYKAVLPTDDGGYGFDPRREPHEDCPRCYGEGKLDLFFGDTRNLSPQGQALFAGIKQTKEGLEVKMHDQKAALDQVARHLGMFNDKLMLQGDAENPLVTLLNSLPGNTLKPVEDE